MDEQSLIIAAQRGDLDAFNELVLKYQNLLFSIALRMLNDEDDAADAVQKAFLSAFRKIASFHGGCFRSWLARITINICHDESRRRSHYSVFSFNSLGDEDEDFDPDERFADSLPSPEFFAESAELAETIQSALRELPAAYRSVAVLVDVEGFSYEEAAETLRVPVGTVKSRLARARAQLRIALKDARESMPVLYRAEMRTPIYNNW